MSGNNEYLMPLKDFAREYARVEAGDIQQHECMSFLNMTKSTFQRYKARYQADTAIATEARKEYDLEREVLCFMELENIQTAFFEAFATPNFINIEEKIRRLHIFMSLLRKCDNCSTISKGHIDYLIAWLSTYRTYFIMRVDVNINSFHSTVNECFSYAEHILKAEFAANEDPLDDENLPF